ncbi:PPE family protein [Mycobacterium rhizamassiliense]|jgi:PPE-repeat protein|uniref:PPE family protein n=1 Tax=Mycobacterium rhizamassiliense TaxID=1841860 RepID=A0A2U3NTG5_9MYCO|nr:PPE family protein [Mycobacterium rhizamassiliense]SPM34753.1 PPE family protein [Mycobacterium rhizamassiliense]
MDFGAMPPEINSGRMYAGPGSGSMLEAASAWDGLAAQLHSAAASYESVVSNLTSGWQGPSSAAMAASATPFVEWMSATAGQAEQAAGQARAAAAAYEAAFIATVPPVAIAENRSQLESLVATNVLGQNTVAIAATEAEYGQMWAQDAAAMYGYAGSSATAAQMTPLSTPPQTTNAGASGAQAGAVAQAAAVAPANAQSTLSQLISTTPRTLQGLASPAAADPSSLVTWLDNLNSTPLARIAANVEFVTKSIRPVNDTLLSLSLGLVTTARSTSDTAVTLEGPLFAALGSSTQAAGAAGASAVSAGLGNAGLAGALSVPPSWAAASPAVRLAATVLECTSAGAAPTAVAGVSGLAGQMALASLAGSALGGAVPRVVAGSAARVARRASDDDGKTPDKLKAVLAELQEAPESVQHWHTDKAHLESLLDQLAKKPGVHAVHLSSADKSKATPLRGTWG